jgi:hypothetical protein
MNVRDLNAMAIVVSGDSLLGEQRRAFDRLADAVKSERAVRGAPSLTREKAAQRVLWAKSVASEFGALGSEC